MSTKPDSQPSVPEPSRRDLLIAKKRAAGLTKDQAIAVADAQIAHEKKLAESTTASPKPKA